MGYRRYLRLGARTPGERRSELDEEIEGHLAMRAEDLMRRGATAEQARREAEARFGNRDEVFESAQERDEMLRRREGVAAVRRDMRLALRQAWRAPGATLFTVLTFGLGIGLATAVFSLVHGVLLRPLPYMEPDRLVLVQGMDSAGNPIAHTSYANWADLAERNRTLESTALHRAAHLAVNAQDGAYRVPAQHVTPQFFDVLKTRMLYGRGFLESEAVAGPGAIVISETLWRRELGGRAEPDLTLRIENVARTVVGVVPDVLAYPAGTHIWVPQSTQQRLGGFFRNYIGDLAIARLRPGVTRAQAESDLSAIARQVQQAEPESDYMYGAPLLPLRAHVIGDSGRYLSLLMSAVAIVLLLACANLAALNLARATRRTSEVAVRYALGASRGVVMRQLLIEQLVLACAGAMLGIVLAWGVTRAMVVAAAGQLPRLQEIGIDARVLLFAASAALLAGLLAGLAPAVKASSASARSLVGSRGVALGGRTVPGAALVGAEIAVAVVLLIGAGLLVRSFQSLLERDTGFDSSGVAAADLMLRGGAYPDVARRLQQWDAIVTRVAAHPTITAAAVANWIPTGRGGTGYLLVEGHADDAGGTGYSVISEDYFAALGIPLLAGRSFEASDRDNGPRVALISRSMAERYWPESSPIGGRFKVPGMEGPRETAPSISVIGVVADVRHDGFEDDAVRNQVYVLYRQVSNWDVAMTLVARDARGDAAAAAAVIRREVRALDASLAVEPESLDHRLGTLLTERRLVLSILAAFGLLALILAGIGVYGLMSFAVAQRTQEIGIRAAIGADRAGIVRLMLIGAARVVVPGAALGLLLAWWLTRVLESMLVDVTRTDPLAWAGAVLVLGAIAFVAALLPARRAAGVDPLTAIRSPQ